MAKRAVNKLYAIAGILLSLQVGCAGDHRYTDITNKGVESWKPLLGSVVRVTGYVRGDNSQRNTFRFEDNQHVLTLDRALDGYGDYDKITIEGKLWFWKFDRSSYTGQVTRPGDGVVVTGTYGILDVAVVDPKTPPPRPIKESKG